MTGLSCLSVTACRASLDVLERLSYSREELAGRLVPLRSDSGARAVAVLSTCQRTEIYATWQGEPDHPALLAALAADRGISRNELRLVAKTYSGEEAARHLLRVASGLESFVLGETEIAGQVRAAADTSRAVGSADAELERLMDAAISASRKRQRQTSIQAAARSVAGLAVAKVTMSSGGTLAGKRLLMVGAGQVAAVVVPRAVEPTLELRAAAEADDGDLVRVLVGLFELTPPRSGRVADAAGLLAADLDAAARFRDAPLDSERMKVRAAEQSGYEGRIHRAHDLTM